MVRRASTVELTVPTVEVEQGPTALRISLGLELRGLREARGITREQAGAVIRGSAAKISRMELGRVGLKPRDIGDLLTAYGVPEGPERTRFLGLVRQSGQPGWWHRYAELLPPWFETYLGLEQAASLIRCYECQFVPGLLQTPDYARQVIELVHRDPREVQRRVELRMRRQAVLDRPEPPLLWAVIDEAVLSRTLTSPVLARAQLAHLIEQAQRPNVRLQIAPFARGGHPAAGGSFSVLRFAEDDLSDVVYLEQLTSSLYLDKRGDVEHYLSILDRLSALVPPPDRTVELLTAMRDGI
jgi:transcriptional regulator with XRE-family HTH domain